MIKIMNIEKKWIILAILLAVVLAFAGFIAYYLKSNNNKEVNIIFNTDEYYKEYTKVAIKSAIVNKNPDSIYHINVLCVGMSETECAEYNVLQEKDASVKVIRKQLSDLKGVVDYEINHYVTRTDLFKFYFCKIFEDLDKALYIDSDTLIRGDLLKLYNTNLKNKYLAAVTKVEPEEVLKVNDSGKVYKTREFIYNCGVMLLNFDMFRKQNMSQMLIYDKNTDTYRDFHTQRVFNNVIPHKDIVRLSPIYNDVARWNKYYLKNYNYFFTFFPYTLRYPTVDILDKNSVIVHYAGRNKPWNTENIKFSDEWWKYAKMINPEWKFEYYQD